MAHRPAGLVDTTTPVVVFRAQFYCELGVVRTLGRMGVKVNCIDYDPDALAMKSRYCTGRFHWDVDASRPEDTVQFLIDVARRIGQKAVLLPTFDTRSLFVDQYREILSKWFLLPQPKPGAVSRLYSKQGMYEMCRSEGIPTPETLFPGSVEQALSAGPSLGFPLLVKAVDAERLMHRAGRRMAVVQQQSELRHTYSTLDEPGISNLALQEFIPGNPQDGWVLSAYFDARSDCRFAITGQKLRQFPIYGGVTTLGVCAPCDPMIDSISRIAKAAGYHGILDADFRYDKRDGLWKLLDINPRPGANFRLLVDKHGFDVVRALYLDLTGQNLPKVEPVWGRRWLVEDKDINALRDHTLEGSLTLGAWFKSLRGVSELAYFAVDDLRPSIAFAGRLAAYHAGGAVRRLLRFGRRGPVSAHTTAPGAQRGGQLVKVKRMKVGWGAGSLLGGLALLLFLLGGFGFYWYRNADLNTLETVVSDLPANIPAIEIVQPDLSRPLVQDNIYAVQGHYTIIEYRQKNCPECARLDKDLERFLTLRKDVAIRKIDLADHWSDKTAMRDYGREIWFTPFVVIYGVDGRQIKADDRGKRKAAHLLYDWLNSEFSRAHGTTSKDAERKR